MMLAGLKDQFQAGLQQGLELSPQPSDLFETVGLHATTDP